MNNENAIKVYVPVEVAFESDGKMLPRAIIWEDGRKYTIDKITDARPAVAMKAGCRGYRYAIWIQGRQSYLFFERYDSVFDWHVGHWFVERRTA